jgi:hypothetical protein
MAVPASRHTAPEASQSKDGRAARRLHQTARRGLGVLSLSLLLGAGFATSAQAAAVNLGTADSFSVLGGSAVTNTGPTVLNGDLGLSPGSAVSGFPPGTVNGAVHVNDAVAGQAKNDLVTAYNEAAGRSSSSTVSGDLAGRTLSPGVYTSASSLGLSGDLTLDAGGNPDAVFVFQAGSTLTTGSGSRVLLTGGAQACNVVWQVGSSATLGTATAFTGDILALTSISLTTGATIDGSALARNGAVTLDTNTVSRSTCAGSGGGGDGDGGDGGDGDGGDGGGGPGGGGPGGNPTGPRRGVITGPPVSVCPSGPNARQVVRLEGRVRRGTVASSYYFQFGRTERYGRRTSNGHLASNTRATRVHAHARGLRPNTTYHYRIVGVTAGGQRSNGSDATFRTRSRSACDLRPARPPRTPRGFTG